MENNQNKTLGFVTEDVDDRVQCLALERGLTREEMMGWIVGIGLTVLEIEAEIPNGKLVYFSGDDFRPIRLPADEND